MLDPPHRLQNTRVVLTRHSDAYNAADSKLVRQSELMNGLFTRDGSENCHVEGTMIEPKEMWYYANKQITIDI
jgi:hypothetical protein